MASTAYNPQSVEGLIYKRWESSGYFNPDNLPGKRTKSFSISMPPPNVTGELHLGHATGIAIQDAFTRYERMRGKKALWVPGTDHAGIATQIVVERLIAQEGVNRHKLGREAFLERVWKWKEQYGSSITAQIRGLGASCDWSREAFTMDKERSVAVRTAFKKLYDDGLIYRGKRIISWCPRCFSAISDLEVKYVETTGKLYSIRYQLSGSTKFVTVATTRPETMLGDTALAVHPEDKRYKKLVGKKVMIPIIEREIPIVADKAVEKDFGTGVVKVTPAHDPLDFEIGRRHKLEGIQVIDETANMTKAAGEFYGMHIQDARRELVKKLEETGHLERVVDYLHNVAHCDRCGTVIEPLISEQWFMRMKPLAKPALEVVKNKKIRIVPERYTKVYNHWLKNIHDWTLSRQLWWGHQIPVWYCESCDSREPLVALKAPKTCPVCKGKKVVQDPDTLDTWFSSGLWTFSTLGWPEKTKDTKLYHPTDVMETGWDILFFWVARMVMMSLYLKKEVPFKTVYLHGLVLDKDGKKMSKSKGTGIDPLPMAKKYGTDAIRLSLILNTTPGQDFRLSEEKIAHYRNFINKLWNIGRFVEAQKKSAAPAKAKTLADRWIQSRLSWVAKEVETDFARFRISDAGEKLYNFVWHELADWYIEICKIEKNYAMLRHIFSETVKLLHPFAPFVTEELWSRLSPKKHKTNLLLVQAYPKGGTISASSEKRFKLLQDIVTAIRTVRNVSQIPHTEKLAISISGAQSAFFLQQAHIAKQLAGLSQIAKQQKATPTLIFPGLRISLTLSKDAEGRLTKEIDRIRFQEQRLRELLSKKQFIAKAPKAVIEENREKLQEAQEQLKHFGK